LGISLTALECPCVILSVLGLMRVLLQDDRTHQTFLGPQAASSPLMLTIKRLLLGHQVSLQVSVSQCLIYLLRGKLGPEFAARLLQEDMAGWFKL